MDSFQRVREQLFREIGTFLDGDRPMDEERHGRIAALLEQLPMEQQLEILKKAQEVASAHGFSVQGMTSWQQEGLVDEELIELPMMHEWERRWVRFLSEQMYLLTTGGCTTESEFISRMDDAIAGVVNSYQARSDYDRAFDEEPLGPTGNKGNGPHPVGGEGVL